MNPIWFVRPDWPMDWELDRRNSLMSAIQGLPKGDRLNDEELEGKAILLYSDSEWGRNEECSHNRPASWKKSERDIRKLVELCEKTIAHIRQMNRPSVRAFFDEGGDLWSVERVLAEASEAAQHSLGAIEVEAEPRKNKIRAAHVTETAAIVFEHVTGQRPTFTTDPDTNEVSGPWPDFLGSVFSTLLIDASVESQARSLREKTRENRS